jgi:hypothetical protein
VYFVHTVTEVVGVFVRFSCAASMKQDSHVQRETVQNMQ